MTKVILYGCNGKMGQVITRLSNENHDVQIVVGIDINDSIKNPYPVFRSTVDCNVDGDVIIDFSNPESLDSLLEFATTKKIPLVLATTGLSDLQKNKLKEASEKIPVFQSANMSLGVNLLTDLVKKAAKVLEGYFDIEIIEKHHNQKIDAPSGTAIMLANAVNSEFDDNLAYEYDRHSKRQKRTKNEIGIHSVRGGTIVGEHDVIFAGHDEVITISHSALSKEVFAVGAVRAAKFLKGKAPGLYDMNSIMDFN